MVSCKGCRLYQYNFDSSMYTCECIIVSYIPDKVNECPCRICLIKTMCSSGCGRLKTFRLSNGVTFNKLTCNITNERVIIATWNKGKSNETK